MTKKIMALLGAIPLVLGLTLVTPASAAPDWEHSSWTGTITYSLSYHVVERRADGYPDDREKKGTETATFTVGGGAGNSAGPPNEWSQNVSGQWSFDHVTKISYPEGLVCTGTMTSAGELDNARNKFALELNQYDSGAASLDMEVDLTGHMLNESYECDGHHQTNEHPLYELQMPLGSEGYPLSDGNARHLQGEITYTTKHWTPEDKVTVTWDLVRTETLADLVVSQLGTPARLVRGKTFSVSETTSNVGIGTAQWTHTLFFLSKDRKRGSTDTLLKWRQTKTLDAGENSRAATSLVVKRSTTKPGYYFVVACADGDVGPSVPLGHIPESNENNNCRASRQVRVRR